MAYFERFVSSRYLFSGERRALVSAMTFVAVSGVAIGVASLVIVLGVMDGAEKDLLGKITEIYPHVKVERDETEGTDDASRVMARAEKIPGLESAEPVIRKESLFSSGLGPTAELVAGQLIGVEDLEKTRLYRLRNAQGALFGELGEREVLLGKPLAEKLRVKEGDWILRITGLTSEKTNRQAPSGKLRVAGIFETGYYAFDSLSAIVSSRTAREALGRGGGTEAVHIKLKDPFAAGQARDFLRLELGLAYKITTWQDENGPFFQSLKIQKFALRHDQI